MSNYELLESAEFEIRQYVYLNISNSEYVGVVMALILYPDYIEYLVKSEDRTEQFPAIALRESKIYA